MTPLVTGGGTTFMEYDYTGMRVKKNAPTGITLFPFKGYEIAPSGLITKFIKIGIETFAAKKGGEKFFYHNDHLGSVNVITNQSGAQMQLNEYDPWGAVSRSVGTIEPTHRFTGQELDPETGLYYYGGRYYDQEISRFISPDPFVQAPENPQNLNRYSYVLNNPQNFIDPTGYDHADGGGTYSIPLYGWVKFFSDWFSDLFGGDDDKKEHRIKRRKQVAAPTPHHEVTVKNGGPENERLQNVRVYDSQPPPWSQDPNQGTGNVRTDYPSEGPVLKTAPRPPHDTTIISICSAGSDSCTDIGLLDILGVGAIAKGIGAIAKVAIRQPTRIYSARELIRRTGDLGPFHNFPESLNLQIFEQGTRTVTQNFWKVPRAGLSDDLITYRLGGGVNRFEGVFEIGVRPSISGNTEVIIHRFFRPNP